MGKDTSLNEDIILTENAAKRVSAILKGEKTTEYREVTPYWSRRLEGRHYDVIKFRNGYAKDAPTMLVEYKGYNIGKEYELKLGKVTEVNYGGKKN